MRILFVTNRNIVNTCGELRLIKNRASALHQEYGVDTDFILFRSDKCLKKNQEEIGANSTMKRYLYSDRNLFSFLVCWSKFKREVYKLVDSKKYQTIILSGNLVFKLAKIIKKKFPELNLLFDIHGALEELIEFNNVGIKGFARRTIYSRFKRIEGKSVSFADGLFVVSNALKKYIEREYKLKNKPFYLVPCAQNKMVIDKDYKRKKRKEYRDFFDIKDNEKLFIYSGGLSPWQCVEESVNLFKHINNEIGNCKMLLLTGDSSAVKKYQDKDIIVDSVPFSKVNDVLCAGDYSFMIRGDCVTNNVAYPNKFIEYVASGMKIITTPYVHDVAEQIVEKDVGFIYQEDIDELIAYIEKGSTYLQDIDKRQALLDDVCFENRLKSFVQNAKG